MSTSEKKVTLRFEVADAGAAQQLGKIAEGANKAAAATKDMRSSMAGGSSGGWPGGLYGAAPPMANGFPSMAGGLHTPNNPAAMQMAALAATVHRDPGLAVAAMRMSGGGAVAGGAMDMLALARAGITPSSGMNMAALAGANYDPLLGRNGAFQPPSLTQARFSGTSDPMLQTMNQNPTNPGTMAALGAGAYRLGAAGLKYGVPAIAAIKSASAVASAVHDSDLVGYQGGTGGEQMRALANGTWATRQVLGIADEFRGRSQGLARVNYDEDIRAKLREGQEQQRMMASQIRLGRIDLESRRDVLNADGRMARISPTDRSTVTGQRDYDRQVQLQPLQQNLIDSERELKMAEERKRRMVDRSDELSRRNATLEIERARLNENAANSGGAERLGFLRQSAGKSEQIISAVKELQSLEQGIEKAKGEIVQLRGQTGQARIATIQGQLSILEQRENTAKGQFTRLGMKTDFEYDLGRRAAQDAKQYGIAALSPERRALAADFAPGLVNELAERRQVQRRDTGLKAISAEFEDAPADIRKQVDKGRNDIADAIRDLKKDVANQASKELLSKDFLATMSSLIVREVSQIVEKFKRDVEMGNNQR